MMTCRLQRRQADYSGDMQTAETAGRLVMISDCRDGRQTTVMTCRDGRQTTGMTFKLQRRQEDYSHHLQTTVIACRNETVLRSEIRATLQDMVRGKCV